MEFVPNLIQSFKEICSRKRQRSSCKSENLINIKRKKSYPSVPETMRPSNSRSSVLYSDSLMPMTSKDLYTELVSNPSSISEINSVISILKDVYKQGEIYLNSNLKKKYAINSTKFKQLNNLNLFKCSKLQKFLDDRNIKEITDFNINAAWESIDRCPDEEVFSYIAEYKVTYRDARRLYPGQWLNDEIINSYIKLCKVNPAVHVFNTYFYSIIETMEKTEWDINKLHKILKKTGLDTILSKSYLVVPVNINQAHWAVVAINNIDNVIEYYESLETNSMENVCIIIEKLLQKLGLEPYDWELMAAPRQNNGFDCGVFMIKIIQALASNTVFNFTSEDIKYYRKIMLLELKEGRLFVD
jgi:Ulp1 family protease